MTRHLLWDAAPGEVRTGLIEQGKLVELRLLRIPDDSLPDPIGALRYVRLGERINGNRALVQVDGDVAEVSPIPALSQGGLFDAKLIRHAIPEPGRWKRAHYRPAKKDNHEASLIPSDVATLICAGPIEAARAQSLLGDCCPAVEINAEAIQDAQLDLWCERAIIGEFVIEGGLLTIERTRAMTMIDIDAYGDARNANLDAAKTIPWLLRLYGIGGQVGIDFLNAANKAERAEIDTALADACAVLPPHECTAMNGFGFVQMVLPRPGPNVLEQLCGIELKAPSIETRALMLLRTASQSIGYGTRNLHAAPEVIAQLKAWPDALDQLTRDLGCDIKLLSDPGVSGYGYVHVSL
jgi:ribonuclease G